MKIYAEQRDVVIPLDRCTSSLNTEKRRVYDIMNIFEGFGAVSRKAKNLYTWKGLQQIAIALEGIQERCKTILQTHRSTGNSKQEGYEEVESTLIQYKFERAKSLGFLCESFICLFLLWKPVITLEEAAMKISKILLNDSKLKTKVRRLYDIANVLCVLKVIKKTLLHTGKPAFQWVGKTGVEEFCMEIENDEVMDQEPSTSSKSCSPTIQTQVVATQPDIQSLRTNLPMLSTPMMPPLDNLISTLPYGLNESSLDLLEGILKVLRRRLHDSKMNATSS